MIYLIKNGRLLEVLILMIKIMIFLRVLLSCIIFHKKIINGEGFGINDIFPAIELIEKMNSK